MGYVSEPNLRKWLNIVKWFRVLQRMVHHLLYTSEPVRIYCSNWSLVLDVGI